MSAPSRSAALRLWRDGNNAGNGFAPGCATPGDESIDGAVRAYVSEGATVIYERRGSDEIAVLDVDGRYVGIGGNAMGNGAWAVEIGNADAGDDA